MEFEAASEEGWGGKISGWEIPEGWSVTFWAVHGPGFGSSEECGPLPFGGGEHCHSDRRDASGDFFFATDAANDSVQAMEFEYPAESAGFAVICENACGADGDRMILSLPGGRPTAESQDADAGESAHTASCVVFVFGANLQSECMEMVSSAERGWNGIMSAWELPDGWTVTFWAIENPAGFDSAEPCGPLPFGGGEHCIEDVRSGSGAFRDSADAANDAVQAVTFSYPFGATSSARLCANTCAPNDEDLIVTPLAS